MPFVFEADGDAIPAKSPKRLLEAMVVSPCPLSLEKCLDLLASPQAAYVTGQELHVNGGMYM